MRQESVQICANTESEAAFYRVMHLMASILWEQGGASQALTALQDLVTEVTPAQPNTQLELSVGVPLDAGRSVSGAHELPHRLAGLGRGDPQPIGVVVGRNTVGVEPHRAAVPRG